MNKMTNNNKFVAIFIGMWVLIFGSIIYNVKHPSTVAYAQQQGGTPSNTYTYNAPPPPAINAPDIILSVSGTNGSTNYCYYVFPHYPIGIMTSNVGKCILGPNTLSGSNFINVGYAKSAAFTAGATGYDIIRLTNINLMPSTCTSCLRVSNGGTSGLYQDKGAGFVGNYTLSGTGIPGIIASITLDNQHQALPMLRLTTAPGNFTWQALPIDPPSTNSATRIAATVNAGATSVLGNTTAINTATLTTSQMLGLGGGGILVGTPTSAATYTSPSAALICTAIQSLRGQVPPNGQSGNGYGTGTYFYIKNTSGGGNNITLAAGSGVTVSGTASVAQNHVREFMVVSTTQPCTTVTIYSLMDSAF